MDILSGPIPKVAGWASKSLTVIRQVFWRLGYVALSDIVGKIVNGISWFVSEITKFLTKRDVSESINLITSFLSTGGAIAVTLDLLTDGKIMEV